MARPLARAPSLADWRSAASRLGLQRRGGELVGPCPACGGEDRFRVTRRGGFFCRQCCPDRNAGADAMRRILEAAGMVREDDGGSLDAGRPRREAGTRTGQSRRSGGVSTYPEDPESRSTAIYGGRNSSDPAKKAEFGAESRNPARRAPDGNGTDKRPSFADWSAAASRLGLKPDGEGMLAGPCPLCRSPSFRVAPDGKIGKCRCKREDLPRILAAAGLVRAADAPEDGRTAPGEDRPLPTRIWTAASRDAAPVRAYLASRGAWPPDAALPPSVRWLDRDAAARLDRDTGRLALRLPPAAAGCIVYCFARRDAGLVAVQIEPLQADGARAPWPARKPGAAPVTRQTRGALRGAAFPIKPSGADSGPIHVAEGPVDVLAIACWRDAQAWGAGGAGMLPALASALAATGRAVVIEADGDGPGRKAAAALQDALHRADAQARLFYWRGCDPAEGLAADWQEHAGRLEDDSMGRPEAEAAAWNAMRPAATVKEIAR